MATMTHQTETDTCEECGYTMPANLLDDDGVCSLCRNKLDNEEEREAREEAAQAAVDETADELGSVESEIADLEEQLADLRKRRAVLRRRHDAELGRLASIQAEAE